MLTIMKHEDIDAVLIEFESGTAGYAEELDPDRIIDYALNPGHPIGVSLHNVSRGVNLNGLPKPDMLQAILGSLGVATHDTPPS